MSIFKPNFPWFFRLKDRLLSRFRPERKRVEERPRTIDLHFRMPDVEQSSRVASLNEWCRAFNRRNGYIVPEVSTESIARRALKLRKRRD